MWQWLFDDVDIVVVAGEAGEIVGKIKPGDPLREFDGYTTSDATKKKIIENVFSKGDKYFLSGKLIFFYN